MNSARLLAKTEALLVGISSGASLKAVSDLATSEEYAGKNLVVILPDGAEKYLSTELFNA